MGLDKKSLPGILAASVLTVWAATATAGAISGTVTAKSEKDAANAVVYVETVKDMKAEPPEKPALMDQQSLTFVPHVLPVLAGTTVEFRNSDDVAHNVFSPDKCAGAFNLGTWAPGGSKTHAFKQAGCVATILCIVHPDMEAYVVVLQNPYFATPGADGTFTIPGVPAGKYTLEVWSEKFAAEPVQITVPATGTVKADFHLK